MGLIDYVRIARRRWWIIAFSTVVGLVLAMGYNSTLVTSYTSTSRMYVSMATGTSVSDAYQGNMAAQQRVTSYVNLVTSTNVMEGVIDSLQLNMTPAQLQSEVTATFAPATVLIDISVSNATADGARVINDAVIRQFQNLVAQIETTEIGAAPAAKVTVVDPPQTPNLPAGPSHTKNLLLGLIAGFVLGCLAALLRDRLDSTVRSESQLAGASSWPVLGMYSSKSSDVDTRLLAMRVEGAMGGASPAIVSVGSIVREVDPKIVLGTAAALAHAGSAVVVVDADSHHSGVTDALGLDHAVGLGDVLLRDVDPMSILVSASDGFAVLPIGKPGHDPAALLGSNRFGSLLTDLGNEFDYVLVASSSLLSPVDALGVIRRADAALLVAEVGRARRQDVVDAISQVEHTGTPVIGLAGAETVSRFSDLLGRFKSRETTARVASAPTGNSPQTSALEQQPSTRSTAKSRGAKSRGAKPTPTSKAPKSDDPSSHTLQPPVAARDAESSPPPVALGGSVEPNTDTHSAGPDASSSRDARTQQPTDGVDTGASTYARTDQPSGNGEDFSIREESVRYDNEDSFRYRNPPNSKPFDSYDPLIDYDPLGGYDSPATRYDREHEISNGQVESGYQRTARAGWEWGTDQATTELELVSAHDNATDSSPPDAGVTDDVPVREHPTAQDTALPADVEESETAEEAESDDIVEGSTDTVPPEEVAADDVTVVHPDNGSGNREQAVSTVKNEGSVSASSARSVSGPKPAAPSSTSNKRRNPQGPHDKKIPSPFTRR